MSEVAARFFDGASARRIDAVVQIGSDRLVVRDAHGAVLAVWPAAEVHLVAKTDPDRPIRLRRGKGAARLVIADTSCRGELERGCANLNKFGPGLREVWRPIALWGSVAVVSLAFLFLVAIPYAARQVALAIPPDVEQRLGAAAVDQVTRLFTLGRTPEICASRDGDAVLARLTERLAADAQLPYPLTVRVINSPVVNAVALPGGQILLFDGLLGFVEGPEEVAGVLAHEIGHVVRRHPLEVFVKNVGAATLIGFLLGDITGGSVIGALVQFTATAAYTREAEREADADAVALMNEAGIDGSGLVEFFERLRLRAGGESAELLSVLNTHPASAERSAFVRANATADGRALSPAQWTALKGICGGE